MAHKKTALKALSSAQLRARRARLASQIPEVELTLRGSLQTQTRRCGREGCRCAAGEPHGPYVYLAVRDARRKQRLFYIPADLAKEVSRRVEVTGAAEELLSEISAINLELLVRGDLS